MTPIVLTAISRPPAKWIGLIMGIKSAIIKHRSEKIKLWLKGLDDNGKQKIRHASKYIRF